MNVTPRVGAPDRDQLVLILAAKEAAVAVRAAVPDLGRLYHGTWERLAGLVSELDEAVWPPGCRHVRPGWSAMWWPICARSART